jgi:hypothetical protein
MSGGGGKGGSQTTEVTIPAWLEDAAKRNIAKAEGISQLDFIPYMGADVAGFSPMQLAAMQGTGSAASAFGLGGGDPLAGIPQPQQFAGGIQGYSSYPLYSQALSNLQAAAPGQYAARQAPFINSVTGAAPGGAYMSGAQQAAAAPVAPVAAAPVIPYYDRDYGGSADGGGF